MLDINEIDPIEDEKRTTTTHTTVKSPDDDIPEYMKIHVDYTSPDFDDFDQIDEEEQAKKRRIKRIIRWVFVFAVALTTIISALSMESDSKLFPREKYAAMGDGEYTLVCLLYAVIFTAVFIGVELFAEYMRNKYTKK